MRPTTRGPALPAVRPAALVVLAVLVAVGVAACGPLDAPDFSADVERELDEGRALAAVLVGESPEVPSETEAIAVGYLERLRLGLGSPFRLIEYGLQDPRLGKPDRERMAWALLAATLDGTAYEPDPRVLGLDDPGRSSRHVRLIENAVRGAADPDVGALAVRLAYTMAAAEGRVSAAHRERALMLAALARDRVLSAQDARRLLNAAGESVDPLSLLTVWRVEHTFAVERPAPVAPGTELERKAIALAPRLLESIRDIEDTPAAGPVVTTRVPEPDPFLDPEAALTLADQAARHDAPPQTPVAVAVRRLERSADTADAATRRFIESATNEERLAAEYALLHHRGAVGSAARTAVVRAAVGLRAYAQERPWFPGFEGPARRDLEDRYGLAAVEFDPVVPAGWRPYYRRMLATALADLERVMPSLDLRGLRVRFAARSGSAGTLAVHDPGSRTVYIPPVTGAGTIAHEIAHDIDWQTALRLYNVRGDYGTERAVRLADARLEPMLRGLGVASLAERPDATGRGTNRETSHATRPAEVFARNVDWFVAVALAREGRLNGYLSSVQDDVLTGYGTVTAPDPTGTAGDALIGLLDQVAPVHPATRRWFLGSYGQWRAPTAYDLARRIVEAPLATSQGADGPALLSGVMERLDALAVVGDEVAAAAVGSCLPPGYDESSVTARRRLVRTVTEVRARGLALEAARVVAGREGRAWVEAALEGRSPDPEPPAETIALLAPLVARVRGIGGGPGPVGWFEGPRAPACGPAALLR